MNPQELRIGNLVHVDNLINHPQLKGKELVVIGISYDSIRLNWPDYTSPFDSNYNQFIEFIRPIQITEEWLWEFGFKYKQESSYPWDSIWTNNVAMINMDKNKFFVPKYTKGGDHVVVELPEYIHQLQNLHFGLTGKELI